MFVQLSDFRHRITPTLAFALLLLPSYSSSNADTVVTIGERDFEDGDQLGSLGYQLAQANEDPALHEIQGIDGTNNPPNTFDEQWGFLYSPPLEPIVFASITIGVYEHDSAEGMASGNGVIDQVEFFLFDGNDLTDQLNTLFEAYGGTVGGFTSEYNIYTVALPQSTFPDLTDGKAVFELKLKNGWGPIFTGADNGAGLDFTELFITPVGIAGDFDMDGDVDGFDFLAWQRGESPNPLSQSDLNDWQTNYGTFAPPVSGSAAVPEPSALVLVLIGIALAARRLRR